MPAIPNVDLITLIQSIITGMLTTSKVHLYKAIVNPPGPNTVIGDFTEADFVGYAAKTAAFGAPYINAAGQAVTDSPLLTWIPTAATTPNTILGYYVTDAAGTTLIFCAQFVVPVNLVNTTDALPLVIQYILQPPTPP